MAYKFVVRSFRSDYNILTTATMAKHITTTSKALNDAVEELKGNPFYEKYADRIAQLQKTSPEEFVNRIESTVVSKKKKEIPLKAQPAIPSGTAKPFLEPKVLFSKTKKLDDVMKTELLTDKSAEDIQHLWLSYHKGKDAVAAVVPKETYEIMFERGKEFSTFLLPLPRNQGYEFIVLQFHGHEIHFTPLVAYQTHKENAPECLTVIHYTELADDKGIVLMKGEYNTDVLQSHEAQCLINQLQLYYSQDNDKRKKIMHRFAYAPDEFKHMDLIAELECLSL